MSYEAEEFVKRMKIKSSPAKLIMLVIANRMSNDTFICFPGIELIAKEASKSVTQVKFHIAKLVEAGVLKKTERKSTSGRWMRNEYEFVDFKSWYRRRYEDTPLDEETDRRAAALPDDDDTIAGNPAMDNKPHHSRVSGTSIAGFAEKTIAGNPALNPNKGIQIESKGEANKPKKLICDPPTPSSSKRKGRQERLDIDGHEQNRTSVDAVLEMDRADFDAYCAMAAELGLVPPARMTSSRRAAIQAIRAAYGASGWTRALAAVRESKFLQGENKRNWRITFDYFIHEDTFAKVFEGGFVDPKPNVVPFKIKPANREEWEFRLRLWNDGGRMKWFHTVWGPLPGQPGCLVPPEILRQAGIDPETGEDLPDPVLPNRNTGDAESA
jgi:hypothetical protein